MDPIYLDYNATSPIDPEVADAMEPYLRSHFGNPSSQHVYGLESRRAIQQARGEVSRMLGCDPDEIIFTSGGSESNNAAIRGIYARRSPGSGNHLITTLIEHPSVGEVFRYLEGQGAEVTWLPVDAHGSVDPADLEAALRDDTVLVSIMHANNEIGTIQPIADLVALAHARGALFHTDCAQTIGKIPVNIAELGVDLLTVAAHKFYGPKGIGALYIRRGLEWEKLIHGANHEGNHRAGTENVLEIVGLGVAARLVTSRQGGREADTLRELRDQLEQGLTQAFPKARVNGHPARRLPNTLSISFPGLEANTILDELPSVMASAGAACHAETVEVSHVLEAMALPLELAMGTLRFSVGRFTTRDEIDRATAEIIRVVGALDGQERPVALPRQDGIQLTHFTHGLGCACKLRPQLLEQVLAKLPPATDDAVLVSTDHADDAAVYRLDEATALVQTVDFFTPIVDDPYAFGAIAAANSLSDLYAMGAEPRFALNIVGFPSRRLPLAVLEDILRGAGDKAAEAGISIIGGHSVEDTEPKFGLVVSGVVHPDRLVRNIGARSGDRLILTKPLGTGILATALKRGALGEEASRLLIESMSGLNARAAQLMGKVRVHAATDITGFGLLGHLLEMLGDGGVGAEIHAADVPRLAGFAEMADLDLFPGGTRDNEAFTKDRVVYGSQIGTSEALLLNDAQTSGGLLLALAGDQAEKYLEICRDAGQDAWEIGAMTADHPGHILVS